jgi:hypothetical protein
VPDIDPSVEQQLADLPPEEWDALCSRVRPPEQHPDVKVRAAAALRAHRSTFGNRTIVATPTPASPGRGMQFGDVARSDRGNAVAALRGHMTVDNDPD